jgi:hypothetical protein
MAAKAALTLAGYWNADAHATSCLYVAASCPIVPFSPRTMRRLALRPELLTDRPRRAHEGVTPLGSGHRGAHNR